MKRIKDVVMAPHLRSLCYSLLFILHSKFSRALASLTITFFISLCSCNGWNDNGSDESCILDRLTDEELDKFNPNIPLTEGSGQSEAFKIHPLDEVRISAPAGAFDVNPDIKVSEATGEQLSLLDSKIEEKFFGHELLWAYDIDAGLPSDSVLPGKYSVEINLKRLGIPEEVIPYVRLCRMDDSGNVRLLNSHINKGVVRYEASQNSVIGLVCIGAAIIGTRAYYLLHSTEINMTLQAWIDAGFIDSFYGKDDMVCIPVEDDFGNFTVVFRYSETECKEKTKAYIEKTKQLQNRMEELETKAKDLYDKDHPMKLQPPTHIADTWREDPGDEMMRRAGRRRIFLDMAKKDSLVQALIKDPDIQLPPSVENVIKATKLANRFSRDPKGLGMKALSYEFNVFLVSSATIDDKKTWAKFEPLPSIGGRILVNFDCYLSSKNGKTTFIRENFDPLCVTMAHEIGHAFENEYVVSSAFTDKRFFEAIGSVTEHWFAAWLKAKGLTDIADTESGEAMKHFKYAYRESKQLLAWPLEKDFPNELFGGSAEILQESDPPTNGGYMLGDLIQFLCDHKKKVNFDQIMMGYAYNKTFVQNLKDIFGIASSQEMAKLYEQFCWKFMPEIAKAQSMFQWSGTDLKRIIPGQTFKPALPVHRVKVIGHEGTGTAYPYTVKIVKISSEDNKKTPYSLFAVPSDTIKTPTVKFTFLEGDSMQQAKNRLFTQPCAKKYTADAYAALFYRPGIEKLSLGPDYYIDIIALYQPKTLPKVLGQSKDGHGLNVQTEAPNEKLVKFKYITGMQLAVVNNATKKNKTFDVPLTECGKARKIPYLSIGITDPEDIDIYVRSRWYYEDEEGRRYFSPATERVKYKREKQHEEQNSEATSDDSDLKDHNDEDSSTDLGDAAMSQKFKLKEIQVAGWNVNRLEYCDCHPVYGTIVLKDGCFKISIPPHQQIKWHNDDDNGAVRQVKGFSITGKYTVSIHYDVEYYDDNSGREKSRKPYIYIEFLRKGLHLSSPFSVKTGSHMTVIGGEDSGYYEYQHTYTYSMSDREDNKESCGFIDLRKQYDRDLHKYIRTWKEIHIYFNGHMSHSVTPHHKDQEEKDLDDFTIVLIGEIPQ